MFPFGISGEKNHEQIKNKLFVFRIYLFVFSTGGITKVAYLCSVNVNSQSQSTTYGAKENRAIHPDHSSGSISSRMQRKQK